MIFLKSNKYSKFKDDPDRTPLYPGNQVQQVQREKTEINIVERKKSSASTIDKTRLLLSRQKTRPKIVIKILLLFAEYD